MCVPVPVRLYVRVPVCGKVKRRKRKSCIDEWLSQHQHMRKHKIALASTWSWFDFQADMVLAVVVTSLVFVVLDRLTGYSTRRSVRTPSPIHLKHFALPLVLAGFTYVGLQLLGVLH